MLVQAHLPCVYVSHSITLAVCTLGTHAEADRSWRHVLQPLGSPKQSSTIRCPVGCLTAGSLQTSSSPGTGAGGGQKPGW